MLSSKETVRLRITWEEEEGRHDETERTRARSRRENWVVGAPLLGPRGQEVPHVSHVAALATLVCEEDGPELRVPLRGTAGGKRRRRVRGTGLLPSRLTETRQSEHCTWPGSSVLSPPGVAKMSPRKIGLAILYGLLKEQIRREDDPRQSGFDRFTHTKG